MLPLTAPVNGSRWNDGCQMQDADSVFAWNDMQPFTCMPTNSNNSSAFHNAAQLRDLHVGDITQTLTLLALKKKEDSLHASNIRPVAFAYITSADIICNPRHKGRSCKSCMQFSNKCWSKQREILQQNAHTPRNTPFLHPVSEEKYKHQCLPCFPQQAAASLLMFFDVNTFPFTFQNLAKIYYNTYTSITLILAEYERSL